MWLDSKLNKAFYCTLVHETMIKQTNSYEVLLNIHISKRMNYLTPFQKVELLKAQKLWTF